MLPRGSRREYTQKGKSWLWILVRERRHRSDMTLTVGIGSIGAGERNYEIVMTAADGSGRDGLLASAAKR
jgi:hypothetical protein